MELSPEGSVEVGNVAFAEVNVTAGPRALPLSKNVAVPEGVPLPDAGVIVAVSVTDCPAVDGFTEDAMATFVAVPDDAIGAPTTGIENGLPGALVVTKMFPLVLANPPTRTSVVGAYVTLIEQPAPAPRLEGQLLLSEKFSVA
jgi:hypothetical protein